MIDFLLLAVLLLPAAFLGAAYRRAEHWTFFAADADMEDETPFLAGVFLAGAFLAGEAFFAGIFLAGAFLPGAFFAGAFFAGASLAAVFFAGAFFAAVFFAGAFFAGAFLAGAFFAAVFWAAFAATGESTSLSGVSAGLLTGSVASAWVDHRGPLGWRGWWA